MLKPAFITILSLLISFWAAAQKDSTIYYMDLNGGIAANKDSADFKLVILPPNVVINKSLSIVKAYNSDGKIKFITSSLTANFPLNLQGDFTEYYPNGNKKRLRHFEKDEESAGFTLWYENGNLKTEMEPAANYGLSEKNYYENGRLKLHRIPKGRGYYDEMEYDANGTLSRKLETNDVGRGVETLYYTNGVTKQVGSFLAQRLEEKIVAYYPNGTPYFTKETSPSDDGPVTTYIECSDSTGKPLTQKGKGYWIEYSDDFSYRALQGKVVKGMPDSVWNHAYTATEGEYETFKQGKKIGTEAYGAPVTDTITFDKVPEYPGGLDAFGHFLANHVRYPATAREGHIQGRVIISFVVERDGSLTNFKVARGVGGGLDEEAIRVMKMSPKWKPGMQNGKPVRVRYSVPISFTLAN
ncbi:MAG TPA: TonB family protein [Mucilaginibacter sp.]|jgi:TonB family protein|nr:TonB family protein [Mucilaginibacter sp.]